MGCCVSIPSPTNQKEISALKKPLQAIFISPPRPEEETVKQVLSETPPKPIPIHVPNTHRHHHHHHHHHHRPPKLNPLKTIQTFERPRWEFRPPAPPPPAAAAPSSDEVSDLSELYSSFGESFDKRDDSAAHRLNRSPATRSKKGTSFSADLGRMKTQGNGSYVAERSPARRPHQSPARRNGGDRDRDRDQQGQRLGLVRHGSSSSGLDGKRKGDSIRRSRSLGTRNEASGVGGGRGNLCRSQSGRKAGRSPGRIRMVQASESGSRKMVENGVGSRTRTWASHPPHESLENPLVSLECFIFL